MDSVSTISKAGTSAASAARGGCDWMEKGCDNSEGNKMATRQTTLEAFAPAVLLQPA
jgi:hypothetical protein